MESFLPFVMIGGFVAVAIAVIFHSRHMAKKRKEALSAMAESMGLTSFPDGDAELLSRLSNYKLFSQGRSRKMDNLIQGDSGEVKIAIFDYRYTTGSGKQSHTYIQSVVSLHSSELVCPDFTMRPEGLFDKIGSALGFQDIDFESHEEFSKLFVLQGSNETAIRNYFSQSVLDFFAAKPGISVEAQSGTLFFYRSSKLIKPEEIKDNLGQAYEIFGMMVDQAS